MFQHAQMLPAPLFLAGAGQMAPVQSQRWTWCHGSHRVHLAWGLGIFNLEASVPRRWD